MQPDGTGTVAADPTAEGVEPAVKPDEEVEPAATLDGAAQQPPPQSWSSYLAAAATASAESHNTGWLRHLVSGSKRRTQSEGFDLDLTYITPQIIALGLPASGVEKLYRNPLSEVRAYLDAKHKSKYAMVNLCNERDYANEDFANAARVFRFPFADHHTCCMSALLAFCKRAQHFFDAKPGEHVLAVHCKAGKGRTGVMICAYLLHAGIQTDAEQALLFFRTSRTTDMDAVNNPGQVRYVRDFARLLAEPSMERRASLLLGPTITLHAVTLSAAPAAFRAAAPAAPGVPSGDVPVEVRVDHDGSVGDGAGGGVSGLASLVLPPWHLKLAVSRLSPHDTPDGVASLRTHLATVGPLRCAPSQARVTFVLPAGGLRVRGDLQLSLLSAAGLLSADDELGWLHVHTSWMPEAEVAAGPTIGASLSAAAAPPEAAAEAPPAAAAPAADTAAPAPAPEAPALRAAVFGKEGVDLVNKDARFPRDWTLTIHYSLCTEPC